MYKCEFDGKCLACEYYGRCTFVEKKEFDSSELYKYINTIWFKCADKNSEHCFNCEKYRACIVERGLPYRVFEYCNVVYNKYPNQDYDEIVYYKKPFRHLIDSENLENEEVDRKRMLRLGEDGVYEPIDDDFTISALQRSIRNATKRSLDTFYGYIQSNDWEYFVTFTFSPEYVDRYDINVVKSLYSEFQRWCKRKSPDVKMIMVPEFHKKEVNGRRALHFHGLMSNIKFNLELAYNEETGAFIYSKTGEPLFHIKDWTYGFSTLAVMPKDNNTAQVANYIKKYIGKGFNIGYNAKRYYHTHNLLFKNKYMLNYEFEKDVEEEAAAMGLVKVKENDKFIAYRKITGAKNDVE